MDEQRAPDKAEMEEESIWAMEAELDFQGGI